MNLAVPFAARSTLTFPQLSQHAFYRAFCFCPRIQLSFLQCILLLLFVCLCNFLLFQRVPIYHPSVGGFVFHGTEQGPGYLSCRKSGILHLPDCCLISSAFGKNARKVNSLQHVIMPSDGQASACHFAYSYPHMGTPLVSEM